MKQDCIFCDLIEHRKQEHLTIYENDDTLVMLDKYPISKGHCLVVLKVHKEGLASVEPDEAAKLGALSAVMSKALKVTCGAESVYVASVGELVKHVHFHIIPRYAREKKGFTHFLKPRGEVDNNDHVFVRRLKKAFEEALAEASSG